MTISLPATTARRGRHAAPAAAGAESGGGGFAAWAWWAGGSAVVALLAYIPLFVVRPGVVTPDTKTYLYLDPGRFLAQVAFMWNPTVGLGTVTHEYIGYLLPMGPFFGILALLHVPIWVAQRLWLGTILFAAGAGILYLSRVLRLRGPGPIVAALAYMLSPYFLQYAGRISVILLPWAGLPFSSAA
jgi:arabinofuranan 3-O-arabinosyltransferase